MDDLMALDSSAFWLVAEAGADYHLFNIIYLGVRETIDMYCLLEMNKNPLRDLEWLGRVVHLITGSMNLSSMSAINHGVVTKLMDLIEPHDHLNPIFIPKCDSPWKVNYYEVVLELKAVASFEVCEVLAASGSFSIPRESSTRCLITNVCCVYMLDSVL
ncbi:hypothetical protein Tco_0572604 [Tanacetum coccineum]